MKAPVEEIQSMFFEAMLHGWAAGASPEVLPDGSEQYVYPPPEEKSDWQVTDRYWVNAGEKYSWGYTLITYRGQPVWHMSYWGWYEKEAIPFLQECLLENYRAGVFHGGRGANCEQVDSGLAYYNYDCKGDFSEFKGREKIAMESAKITELGTHSYQGGLLFKPD